MDIASELIKKAPRAPEVDCAVRKRLEKLKNRSEPKDNYTDDNFNLLLPPSPPRSPSLEPQSPRPPLGPPAAPPFFKPPSGRFLEPFHRPTAQPRPPPPLKPKDFIGIPLAPSARSFSPGDYFLLGSSAQLVSPAPRSLTPTPLTLSLLVFIPSNNLYGSQTQTLTKEKKNQKNQYKKNLMIKSVNCPMILQNLNWEMV